MHIIDSDLPILSSMSGRYRLEVYYDSLEDKLHHVPSDHITVILRKFDHLFILWNPFWLSQFFPMMTRKGTCLHIMKVYQPYLRKISAQVGFYYHPIKINTRTLGRKKLMRYSIAACSPSVKKQMLNNYVFTAPNLVTALSTRLHHTLLKNPDWSCKVSMTDTVSLLMPFRPTCSPASPPLDSWLRQVTQGYLLKRFAIVRTVRKNPTAPRIC